MGIEELKKKRKELFFSEKDFEASLVESLKSVERYRYNLSFFLLSIDESQSYDGEEIKEIEEALKTFVLNQTRLVDRPFKIDRDQYIVFLSHTNKRGALSLAERIRMRFSRFPITVNNKNVFFTVSGSVISVLEDNVINEKEIVARLKFALERARAKGGNYICPFSPNLVNKI